ncbi:hypothetical protein ASE16_03505 [Leifsonia sp. Root227]|nr:hypothetical protein ASE16_03505 [Leifsonia sp. Root227]
MYEGDRLMRTITRREPEFRVQDRVQMLAFQSIEEDMGPYGIPVSEAMDPKNQFAYVPSWSPSTNWAVKAVEDRKDSFYEANKDSSRNGHVWSVSRADQS